MLSSIGMLTKAVSSQCRTHRCFASVPDPIQSLPWQFLRAADSSNFDPETYQRVDVNYDSSSGKPASLQKSSPSGALSIDQVHVEGTNYRVEWNDGISSVYPMDWVQQQADEFRATAQDGREYWTNLTEEGVRASSELSMRFEVLITEHGMKQAVQSVYRHGILLVTGTPIENNAGVATIGAAFGGGSKKDNPSTSLFVNYSNGGSETMLEHGTDGPLRTLYGSVWSTSSTTQQDGTSMADSAYGSDGLPLHTDMTYMREPPGLQIFTMVQPAPEGGESVFGDGFAVANELRSTDPASFEVLSTAERRYRCVDSSTGWNLQATGPVIRVRNGRLVSIRHNDLDRLPDLPTGDVSDADEIDTFYKSLQSAHDAWDALLTEDRFRLVMKLKPGDTMVVANQRCFHGRCNFTSSALSSRVVMGCYTSQDELSSRFREEGLEDL